MGDEETNPPVLSRSELERYNRQILIPNIGFQGQRRLKSSRVVVVGVGGLGCPASIYLAAAGVGMITLIDKGRFNLSDLNRQILAGYDDIGRLKVEVARDRIKELNPDVEVKTLTIEVDREAFREIVREADVVVDGLDNWRGRFIVNECCVMEGKPYIHAGVSGLSGQITTIIPGEGPCLRCIIPRDPPEVDVVPVLGATPALLASLQVMETVKLVTGFGRPLVGRMLFIDGEDMSFESVEVKRNPDCPVCGKLQGRAKDSGC